MEASIQTTGVRVSISRTITPAKYTADTAYNTTGGTEGSHDITQQSHDYHITKDSLVGEVFHDEPDTSGEHAHEDV